MNARALLAALFVASIAAAVACSDRSRALVASPLPSVPPSSCEGCHAAIAAEWQASFHRSAFSDETFQRSLALEETKEHAFCTRCHAPAAERAGVAVGVDCTSCHVTPHAERAAGTAVCATCHEFTFDDGRPELVQKTVSEHAASAYAGVGCAQCHMPSRDGHKDHRFLAGHAPGQIARAVHVEVARSHERDPTNALRVAIHVDAGHAFPTGDMFRRARLLVFAEGATGAIVADAERIFGRTWAGVRGGAHESARTQVSDSRILGAWHEVIALDEPSVPIVRVRWSLVYERVVAVRGPHVSMASSDVIAEGTVSW